MCHQTGIATRKCNVISLPVKQKPKVGKASLNAPAQVRRADDDGRGGGCGCGSVANGSELDRKALSLPSGCDFSRAARTHKCDSRVHGSASRVRVATHAQTYPSYELRLGHRGGRLEVEIAPGGRIALCPIRGACAIRATSGYFGAFKGGGPGRWPRRLMVQLRTGRPRPPARRRARSRVESTSIRHRHPTKAPRLPGSSRCDGASSISGAERDRQAAGLAFRRRQPKPRPTNAAVDAEISVVGSGTAATPGAKENVAENMPRSSNRGA